MPGPPPTPTSRPRLLMCPTLPLKLNLGGGASKCGIARMEKQRGSRRGRYAYSLLKMALSITQACRCGHGLAQARCPLCACLLTRLGGIRLSLVPPAIINGLDPRAPSATAPPPPNLLHMALTSHLLDETR
jgi:hypothetical protein